MNAHPNQPFPLRLISVISAVVTGVIAVTGYLGVLGLLSGSLTFGETINARLPFGSRIIAGVALLIFVAGPMTVATVAVVRRTRGSADLVFGAGLLLVAWIGVQLAFIEAYSWFQPTYLALACAVLALGWLLARGGASQLRAGASNADDSADTTGRGDETSEHDRATQNRAAILTSTDFWLRAESLPATAEQHNADLDAAQAGRDQQAAHEQLRRRP